MLQEFQTTSTSERLQTRWMAAADAGVVVAD
jgi:hypothetical protein